MKKINRFWVLELENPSLAEIVVPVTTQFSPIILHKKLPADWETILISIKSEEGATYHAI